jgi:hypothetical protein
MSGVSPAETRASTIYLLSVVGDEILLLLAVWTLLLMLL